MNNLYEYIDPIASPYEAFLFDSTRDLLPIPAHWHYYVELLYVRKGEIEVSLDNVVSTCTKGAVILFPLFSDILSEYQSKEFGYSMVLTADLRKIVTKFARIWQKNGDFFLAPGVHPSYEIGFDLISEYIDSHYFEELTVEKLAAMCNMSHSTFSMNFYRRYNMTCKEYITATRINAAENMLLFSSHDISFIAREVGYTDCSYFIRCYKKLKGITPKQARKLQLGR